MDDKDTDEFFEVLAGRASSRSPGAGVELSGRLRALIQRTNEAESKQLVMASKAGLEPDERAAAQRVWARLKSEGLVGDADLAEIPQLSARNSRVPSLLRISAFFDSMRETIFGGSWQRGFALATVAMLGVLVVFQLDNDRGRVGAEDIDPGHVRGADDTVPDAKPTRRQEALVKAFREAGATVVAVQSSPSPDRWMIEVTVNDPAALLAVNSVRRQAGLKAVEGYKFVVKVVEPPKR